jgi:hypothetical protein
MITPAPTQVPHTPTPWAVQHDPHGYGQTTFYSPSNPQECCQYGDANAAFIVEAVNSHSALLSRVRELEVALRQFEAHYPMGINPFLDDAYRAARAALSHGSEEGKWWNREWNLFLWATVAKLLKPALGASWNPMLQLGVRSEWLSDLMR